MDAASREGVFQIVQYGVAALGKGTTIACGLRLVLNNFGNAAFINPVLSEY